MEETHNQAVRRMMSEEAVRRRARRGPPVLPEGLANLFTSESLNLSQTLREVYMFNVFSNAVAARYAELSKGELYVTEAGDLWEAYLAAYPEGTNPIFRERTEHDCQSCKQFVVRLGHVVGLKDGKVVTVWDNLNQLPYPFKAVADKLSEIVRAAPIKCVFRTKEAGYGCEHNYDKKTNQKWDHLHGTIAAKHLCADPDTKRGELDGIFQVAKRGLLETRESDLDAVLDLVDSNALYRGEEHKPAILGFKALLQGFKASGSTDTFVWANLDNRNCRFRATVIGTLMTDLAEGKDIEHAVKSFESKVAPANYKRPTAIITQGMVEKAVETMNNLGLGGAIYRRFAKLSDVSVNDVLFVDNDSRSKMKDGIALLLESSVKKATPDVKNAVTIAADEFVKDILPKAKSLEVLVENRHLGNFVSLTAPKDTETVRLFKWGNNFAWSYDGDVTDSVKQRVKAAGGNIHAKLRVSLSWFNFDDLDLHANTPLGPEIYYGNKQGILDVDMNAGTGRTRTPVENLAFNQLRDGVYTIHVRQFTRRETIDFGFSIEVEFAGVVNQYSYAKSVSGDVQCFDLTIKGGELVKIDVKPGLVGGSSSQEKWGVKTETLVPAASVMYSPNHWGDQTVGAKHLIFALKNCKNPEATRGIYNEFLRGDLDQHRKVFEVLGSKSKCPFAEEQISGVGFTAARGDSVTVVVDGRRSYILGF